MKKTYKLNFNENEYIIENEKDEKVLIIKKDSLLLEGNKFYEVFFKDFDDSDEIELVMSKNAQDNKDDKLLKGFYNTIKDLLVNIATEISSKNK